MKSKIAWTKIKNGMAIFMVMCFAVVMGTIAEHDEIHIPMLTGEPTATTDTVKFIGTTPVNFTALSNDAGAGIAVFQYNFRCAKYNPVTTAKTFTGFGKLVFRPNGTGTFTPAAGYAGGEELQYTVFNTCGTATAKIYFLKLDAPPVDPPVNASYTLTVPSTTSGGVYKNGILVRTIWSARQQAAGIYTSSTFPVLWDGKDNEGVTVTAPYQIKVLGHQMSYTWEATIGNNSSQATGDHKVKALRTPHDAVTVGNNLYMCVGFVEGNSSIIKIPLDNINYMTELRTDGITGCGDVVMETTRCASDGTRVYWAGFDAWDGFWPPGGNYPDVNSNCKSLIYATRVSDDADHTFSSGTTVKASLSACNTYSAIDVSDQVSHQITGLAVQTTGNYLYSSHSGDGTVKCFNKTTGATVQTISLPLGDIAIEGNFLYGVHGSTVKKYTINGDGTLTATAVNIAMSQPYALSVQSGILLVIELSTQQVKAYNSSGSLLWTQGTSGGYLNSPAVSNSKFMFKDFSTTYNTNKGFVCQQANGFYWVGDAGNCRTLRYGQDRVYADGIWYLPMNYSASVDKNNPNRVFAGYLEFNATTGALVNNWAGNITSNYRATDVRDVLYNVVTISGKTFGTIDYYAAAPDPDPREFELVELGPTGIRYTGIRFGEYKRAWIEGNGDVVYLEGDNQVNSGTGSLMKKTYAGLNGSGNMTWLAPSTISTFPLSLTAPYAYSNSQPSSKGYIFSDNKYNTGYHLGRVVGGQYVWKTSPSTTTNYTGWFPRSDTFDIGNGVEYAGRNLFWYDSVLVWNYIGEFWKNSQVNVWKLFHQDGLMLLNIGTTALEAQAQYGRNAAPMAAGNALGGGFTKVGSDYYIYHCDESHHGAIHRFKITGGATMKWHVINIP